MLNLLVNAWDRMFGRMSRGMSSSSENGAGDSTCCGFTLDDVAEIIAVSLRGELLS